MKNNNNASTGGLGFCSVLTLIFIVLKLLKVITWSWWWVLSPLWIGFLIGVVIIILGVFIAWRNWK